MLTPDSYNKSYAKGPVSTTWIWNLHSDAHEFLTHSSGPSPMSSSIISRKVTSVSFAHLGIVSLWLSGMLFHSAFFSNLQHWIKNPMADKPSAHVVYSIVGQDILNTDVGSNFKGLYITSALFNVWISQGIVGHSALIASSALVISLSLCFCFLSYYEMHSIFLVIRRVYHVQLLSGLSSISWCGHQLDVPGPILCLLSSSLDPAYLPAPEDLLSSSFIEKTLAIGVASPVGSHHFYIGLSLLSISYTRYKYSYSFKLLAVSSTASSFHSLSLSLHSRLSVCLILLSLCSSLLSNHFTSLSVYIYLSTDYPSVFSLSCHHVYIASISITGSIAYLTISLLNTGSGLVGA